MREFNYLVFMGRFQPLHNGHIHVINRALDHADKIIVLVGSANLSRSPRNPFTYSERRQMIEDAVESGALRQGRDRIIVRPIADFPYNDAAWIASVQHTVDQAVLADNNPNEHTTLHGTRDFKIGLVGHAKDHTSYYLKLFPEWRSIDVTTSYSLMSATDLRNDYLRRSPAIPGAHLVPLNVQHFLTGFMLTEHFKWLVEEQEFYIGYRRSWDGAPYPVFITCVDTVVVQSGHVLLVRRAAHPGKGLLALPGGHVNPKETFRAAAIRELKEETRISDDKGEIPPAMLASFIEDSKTRLFDAVHRSERGRVVTEAYYLSLPNRTSLFSVKGDDDAASASWHPLGSLRSTDLYEDHAAIITEMTGYTLQAD